MLWRHAQRRPQHPCPSSRQLSLLLQGLPSAVMLHLQAGLTNYAATYATGLLLARRVLQKFNLDSVYTGAEEATGEDYNVEASDDGPRPFTALLDTGLKRTSTGSKVFAALKVKHHPSYLMMLQLCCYVGHWPEENIYRQQGLSCIKGVPSMITVIMIHSCTSA